MDSKASLGTLLFLWIGLGLGAAGQTLRPPAEISGVYDCSVPGFTKQKLIFLSEGRWVKGPLFDHAASKMHPVAEKTLSYRGSMFWRRDPGRRGRFRIERDRVVLYSDPSVVEHLRSQGYVDAEEFWAVQEFRIDPATGSLIEVPWFTFRRPLICTRDGFF